MKNLNLPNTNEFLIPSTTGEYLPTNITMVYEAFELEDSNPELFDELMDNGIQIIYAVNIKEARIAFDELLKQLTEILQSGFIGDDDFYDYLPDLFNQMQHIAFCYNYNCEGKDPIDINPVKQYIINYDKQRDEEDELLQDQCEFCDPDFTQIISEQQTIQEILSKFPEDQQ